MLNATMTIEAKSGSMFTVDLWVMPAANRFKVANLVDLMLNFYCFASAGLSGSTRERLVRSSINYSEQLIVGFILATKLRSIALPFQRFLPSPTIDLRDD